MGCAVASTCLATDSNTSGMIPSVAFKAISTLHTYSLTFKLHALPCSRFYLVIGHRFLTFSVCLNHYHMLATVAVWTQCTKCTKCRQGADTSRESTARRGQNVVTTKFDMSQFPCYSPNHSEVFCAKPAVSSTLCCAALRCSLDPGACPPYASGIRKPARPQDLALCLVPGDFIPSDRGKPVLFGVDMMSDSTGPLQSRTKRILFSTGLRASSKVLV